MTKVYVVTKEEYDPMYSVWEQYIDKVFNSIDKALDYIKNKDEVHINGYKLSHFIDEYEVE